MIASHPDDCSCEDCWTVREVEEALSGAYTRAPQPPWLEKGDLVLRLEDQGRAIVLTSEMTFFGELYRLRMIENGSELELTREELVFVR